MSARRDVAPLLARIATRYAAGFPEALPAWRTIGREAEFPVVRADGSAAEVQELLPRIAARCEGVARKHEGALLVGLETPSAGYAAEVGRGTVEVILPPADDLPALEARHRAAMAPLFAAAEELGLRVLGCGMQPLTPASAALLCPKSRYRILHEVLGEGWLWFTTSASDQLHVDVGRAELVAQVDRLHLLTPVVVALCGNSVLADGVAGPVCCLRDERMGRILPGEFRHGLPAGPCGSIAGLVEQLCGLSFILQKEAGAYRPGPGTSFRAWLEGASDGDFARAYEAFLLHDHYIWNSARPRSKYGTIELRAACQQPHASSFAAAALQLALVEAGAALDPLLAFPAPWPTMRRWHHAAVREGLAAEEPRPGFLRDVLGACAEALRARGRGEEAYLAPLWTRLERRANPAQESRALWLKDPEAALQALAARG